MAKHGLMSRAKESHLSVEKRCQVVIGRSKPAREGQMKTGHFESGIAHGAAIAALMRDEPTQREPATFHCHAGGQRLVGPKDCPRTGRPSGDGGPVSAPAAAGFKTGHSAPDRKSVV